MLPRDQGATVVQGSSTLSLWISSPAPPSPFSLSNGFSNPLFLGCCIWKSLQHFLWRQEEDDSVVLQEQRMRFREWQQPHTTVRVWLGSVLPLMLKRQCRLANWLQCREIEKPELALKREWQNNMCVISSFFFFFFNRYKMQYFVPFSSIEVNIYLGITSTPLASPQILRKHVLPVL